MPSFQISFAKSLPKHWMVTMESDNVPLLTLEPSDDQPEYNCLHSVWVDEERQNDDNKARWWGWDCASIQFEVGSQPTKVEIYVYYHDLCVERWSMGGGWCRHRGSEAARALSVASRSCRPPWSRSPTAVASPGAASLLLPRESHVCLIKVCSPCRRSRHCPAAQSAHSPLVWSQDSPWPMLRESFPSCVLRPRNTSRRACLRDTIGLHSEGYACCEGKEQNKPKAFKSWGFRHQGYDDTFLPALFPETAYEFAPTHSISPRRKIEWRQISK